MRYIKRNKYLNKLISLNNTPDIKVITGIRRSGKSVLLNEYVQYLKKNEQNINVININLLDLKNIGLLEYKTLHDYVMSHYKKKAHNVVVIDEVQLCPKFELTINSLHSKGLFDIYITGSNAFLLSSDLATLFTGRTMQVQVFPFSFKEYLQYYKYKDNFDEHFDDYVLEGGLAGSYVYKNDNEKRDYIRDVYETILLRDLVSKYKIRNKDELIRITEFMMDNVSNLLSSNNMAKELNKNSSSITDKTIKKYIDYLSNSFLFYEVGRYDLKGKSYLSNNRKYYLVDQSFRYAINGTKNMDYGRVYENMVAIELMRRGYEIYVGKLYQKEIDFVARKNGSITYIQVSDNITEETTFKREYEPLLQIKDAYPKMIIARTRHRDYSYEGIVVKDIVNWLREED